jgi:hypothetical protein
VKQNKYIIISGEFRRVNELFLGQYHVRICKFYLFMVNLKMLLVAQTIQAQSIELLLNDEFERMWMKAVVT